MSGLPVNRHPVSARGHAVSRITAAAIGEIAIGIPLIRLNEVFLLSRVRIVRGRPVQNQTVIYGIEDVIGKAKPAPVAPRQPRADDCRYLR